MLVKYTIQNWDRKYDGILFLIQRLESMLFHYSDDIDRAPIHNTATLIKEYVKLANDKNIQSFHLEIVASELSQSIQTDEIIKKKYGNNFIERIINSLKSNTKETIFYLHSNITLEKYYNWCIEALLDEVKNPKNKKEINSYLRKWIASTIDFGYSSSYIYRNLQNRFTNVVENPQSEITEFLNQFNLKAKRFKVYFLFMGSFLKYKELLEQRLEIIYIDDGYFEKLRKKDNKAFIGCVNVDAIDSYRAVEFAYARLEIFISFYRVISNRNKEIIGKTAYVRNCETEEELYIPVLSEGFKNIEIEPKTDLRTTIDAAILGCQTKTAETYTSIRKIIMLHNMALRQVDLEDGFLNLWSALEIVGKDSKGDSKVEKVINSILPILQNDFFRKYFEAIISDLKNALSRDDYKKILLLIPEEGDEAYKIACFTLLGKYEREREELFEKITLYPNLRQRIYKGYCLRENRDRLFQISEKYSQRLKWHIYRLYRVRNGIVHAGERDRKIQVLGEHLHIYCDAVITDIIVKLATKDNLDTIQDVLVDSQLLVQDKRNYFKESGEVKVEDIKLMMKNSFVNM